MGLKLIAAPTAEPLTLAEVKLHCREDRAVNDTLLQALIQTARQQAENRTGRALITQQWRLSLKSFNEKSCQTDLKVDLPRPSLQSVESITYLDTSGIRQILASNQYQVVVDDLVGYVCPAYGLTWPSHRIQPDSVQITYTAGYADSDSVPASIKSWMLMAIAAFYANPEALTGKQTEALELPTDFFNGLLDTYLIPTL